MRAFITGASRGIGKAIVNELAPELSHAVLLARNPEGLEQAREQLVGLNRNCGVEILACDLADLEETARVLDGWTAKDPGAIDLLVLVAGTYTEGTLSEIDFAAFESDLRVNLSSSVLITQKMLPGLRKGKRPKIVIIGSTAAYEDYPLVPSYGVAKWGLRSYASNLRLELREERIGVTFLSPGGTLTDMWEGEELEPGRLLEPSDIARLVRASLTLSPQAVVEELIVRPIEGDIHE